MKKHQVIFEKVKILLEKVLGEKLNIHVEEYDDGYKETHLTINDTAIWISCDDKELTVGYGLTHTHYDPQYDNIQMGIDRFFNLITKRKRITNFYKGNFSYKNKTEIVIDDSTYEDIGIAMTWLFPYWKKTKKEVIYEESLIDQSKIEVEIKEIKNYAQQGI
ncbi:hypothetical protein [Xanthovirga aplysinae]|uniref:hypothetical protein n=1 Tax=Xanthovirga aplysinae TaxID=2529853 RepID=UPI001656D348|nr:hypothetical protein [Xanthovirga aplysinae]MTI29321.1 hypothetical protein [Xanthovirga aplysinae]